MTVNQNRASKWSIVFLFVGTVSKRIRTKIWRWWYNQLASKDQSNELVFMNYGYASSDKQGRLVLEAKDEKNRYPIQLYDQVVKGIKLQDKNVVEVGCGRGGGATYLASVYQPKLYSGIDLSQDAIAWCRTNHRQEHVQWYQGRAEAVPIKDGSTDVVVNVESSHCYPSMIGFLQEVTRILKPNGVLAFCDMRKAEVVQGLENDFKRAGLEIIFARQINQEVVAALDKMSDSRSAAILDKVPKFFQKVFGDFVALKGTRLYQMLKDESLLYLCYQCRKI